MSRNTTTRTTDPDPAEAAVRRELTAAGLLPDPDNPAGFISAIGSVGRDLSAAVPELERVVRNLAIDLAAARRDIAAHGQAIHHLNEIVDQLADALTWIRDNYDLDTVAVDVIAHAVQTAAVKPASHIF